MKSNLFKPLVWLNGREQGFEEADGAKPYVREKAAGVRKPLHHLRHLLWRRFYSSGPAKGFCGGVELCVVGCGCCCCTVVYCTRSLQA